MCRPDDYPPYPTEAEMQAGMPGQVRSLIPPVERILSDFNSYMGIDEHLAHAASGENHWFTCGFCDDEEED